MEIRILGAHNIETKTTGSTCLLIDDILAVDAGALTSSLTIAQQQNLKAVLLTHQHYDHTKDIPVLGMNFFVLKASLEIYTTQQVYDVLTTHLLNNVVFPNWAERPPEKPVFHFNIVEAGKAVSVAGYSVLPVPVNHAVPTVGYEITSFDGKKVFITADTGPGLEDCWKQINPNLIIAEMTMLNDIEGPRKAGHLSPQLLEKELESFREMKGYLPQVVLYHLDPLAEETVKEEIREVEKALSIKIRLGYEGMRIKV
ncbi:MAG: MBL fold metallo-hydrolase [Dehalococcoidales bacterium]|nr:MBL fold metallo-hydrolase [Dehalococcoidales bacterium]